MVGGGCLGRNGRRGGWVGFERRGLDRGGGGAGGRMCGVVRRVLERGDGDAVGVLRIAICVCSVLAWSCLRRSW